MRRLILGLIIGVMLMMGGSIAQADDYSWLLKQGPVWGLDQSPNIWIYPYSQYGFIYQYPYTYRSPSYEGQYDSPIVIVPARPCELWQLKYPWLRCE